MSDLPRDYDAWRLAGPDDDDTDGDDREADDDDFADWLRDQKHDREMDDE